MTNFDKINTFVPPEQKEQKTKIDEQLLWYYLWVDNLKDITDVQEWTKNETQKLLAEMNNPEYVPFEGELGEKLWVDNFEKKLEKKQQPVSLASVLEDAENVWSDSKLAA